MTEKKSSRTNGATGITKGAVKPVASRKSTKAVAKRKPATSRSASPTVVPAKKTKATTVSTLKKARPSEWDTLPTVPLETILRFLLIKQGNTDLASLREVSRSFKRGVDTFMNRPKNRRHFDSLVVEKTKEENGANERKLWLNLKFSFFAADLPFIDLSSIDWTIVKGKREGQIVNLSYRTLLSVNMPIGKIHGMFTPSPTHIRRLEVCGMSTAKDIGHTLDILRPVTTNDILFDFQIKLPDFMGEKIKEVIAATSAKWCEVQTSQAKLTNPAAFIAALDALVPEGVSLVEDPPWPRASRCFGLHDNFWLPFLNEKLQRDGGTAYYGGKQLYAPLRSFDNSFQMNLRIEWS